MQQINKPYEGLFITIEGGEGSGKSTLADSLAKELTNRGYSVFKTREPGGTLLSEHIRQLLLYPKEDYQIGDRAELFLFLAARAQHVEESILPALRQGKVVICERFNDSTIAYQGGARYLGMHFVEQICKFVCDMEPNCTLFLDLDPAEGMRRVEKQTDKPIDRVEHEHLQFHKEVRQGFLHLADKYPNRISVLDASLPPGQVLAAALKEVEAHLMLKPSKK